MHHLPTRRRPALHLLGALLALSACADIPRPYRGAPGGVASRLAVPLAIRLAVPPPGQALLGDAAARQLAEALSEALQAQEVPAVATAAPLPLDWRLVVTAENRGAEVSPRFDIQNADGTSQGTVPAPPVPTRRWAEATPETLMAVAQQAAPGVARMLLGVQAARASASTAAIAGGPVKLRLIPVRGAPGDGNQALTSRLREFLSGQGYVVQELADGAAYGVTAEVNVAAGSPGMQRVEIQWIVSRRDGEELGRVLQLNEVRVASLNRFWGDVAYAAAQEAAGGVQTIIRNATTPPPA
jgi:hypothetical protein